MLHPIAFVLDRAIWALQLILLAYIVLSWLRFWQQSSRSAPRIDLDNPVVRWIEGMAYTMLHPIRRVIDPYQRNTGIDFSAIIAFLILGLVQSWVAQLPF